MLKSNNLMMVSSQALLVPTCMQLWLMIPYFPKLKKSVVSDDIRGQIGNFSKGVVNQRKREKFQDHFIIIIIFFTDNLYLSASIISHCHFQPISISTKALKSKTLLLSQLSPSGLSLGLSLFAWDTAIGQTNSASCILFFFFPHTLRKKKHQKTHCDRIPKKWFQKNRVSKKHLASLRFQVF